MSLEDAADRSTVITALRTALATSRVCAAVRTVTAGVRARWRRLHGSLGASRSVVTLGHISRSLTTTGRSSTARSLTGRLSRWAQASALYRWLTAEPDPDVVVIDLRDTYAVGPVISVLDRVAAPLGRLYRGSTLQRLAERGGRAADVLADTRIGQVLGRALSPPEPPDRPPGSESDQATRSSSEDDRNDPP